MMKTKTIKTHIKYYITIEDVSFDLPYRSGLFLR